MKHQAERRDAGEVCPPADYLRSRIANAYRWVFNDIHDSRNFVSPLEKDPPRFLHVTHQRRCEAKALSMFDNLAGAKARFKELKSVMGAKVYTLLGCKIAVGSIDEHDGVVGDLGRHGHFNLHPSEHANFISRFGIIEEEL